ncbi:MAG: DUF1592 domain-containing protein [Verrucomicrobiales bacterium]
MGLVLSGGGLSAAPLTFASDIRPLLEKYCWDCHGDGMDKGGLSLDAYTTEADLVAARKKWEGILFNIDNWLMPPVDKEQPTAGERKRLVRWIDDTVFPVDPANPDPGRVTIRRLNRTEYNHTIRDLLGVDERPADGFPDDDSGYGFDNIGDVLAMPPVLVERYLAAADAVVGVAVPDRRRPPTTTVVPAEGLSEQGTGQSGRDGVLALVGEGAAVTRHRFEMGASYRIQIRAYADQAGDESAKLTLRIGDQDIQTFEITGTAEDSQSVEATVRERRGEQSVAAAFINDYYADGQDRNIYIKSIEITGPIWSESDPLPESYRRLFVHEPGAEGSEAATRQVLTAFLRRAYRRPGRPEEVAKLAELAGRAQQAGTSWEQSVAMAFKAALVSPHFLYRVEWQADEKADGEVVELGEFALASRLSYFLWSTMPDDQLLERAENNALRQNLAAEIKRMLADPKARELARQFGGQWLETRNLAIVAPNTEKFPWDGSLRDAMRGETEEFFHFLLTENRSVLEFLSADYSFVNERLARHYGMDGVQGSEFQRVSLDTARRRGLLTHASVLTVTSDPTRTSPVKRGKWVLENLLGTPPPPPPPNVPALEEVAEFHGTLRQRLEQHRANPACANCHAMLDPIGFGLENFDAVGAWRDQDEGQPVESAGRLTSGQEFANASDLTTILLRDKSDQFVRTLASKLLTYALGRGVEFYDKPALSEIMEKTKRDNHMFHALITAVAESVPFQKRRGDGWTP